MIRYRRLYEDEEFIPPIYIPEDVKIYDVVRCAGYEWYVINKQGDIVTLLAKNADFGKCEFDQKSSYYKTSEIRDFLGYSTLPRVKSANPIPTRLIDVGVTDKVWLLSVDEAEDLPEEIREFHTWYWLRSRGYDDSRAANVDLDGGVNDFGNYVYNGLDAVRPAMRVHIEDLD